MFSKFNISEIFTDGLKLLKVDSNRLSFIMLHLLIPIFANILAIKFNIRFDKDIISNIISSISLFSGLLFSVIFILTGNYSTRRSLFLSSPKQEEEDERYLDRYRKFTSDTSTLILFSVLLAMITIIILFSFLLIEKIVIPIDKNNFLRVSLEWLRKKSSFSSFGKKWFLSVFQGIGYILLFNYVLVIFIIVKEVYTMVYDDIYKENKK